MLGVLFSIKSSLRPFSQLITILEKILKFPTSSSLSYLLLRVYTAHQAITMHFSSLLALTGLTLTAAAPAALDARTDATWTLKWFNRICDDAKNVCDYHFNIVDSASSHIDYCRFSDDASGTSRIARYSSPSNLQCSEDSPVFVNIGYDQPGNFFVVVPVNTGTKKNAFFGYTADEMKDNVTVTPDHTSPTLTVGEFKKAKRGAAALQPRHDLGQWSALNLHRSKS